MKLSRRSLLQGAGVIAASHFAPSPALAEVVPEIAFTPMPGKWRTFEKVIRVEIAKPEGRMQAWLPISGVDEPDWNKSGASTWVAEGAGAAITSDPKSGAKMLHVVWPEGAKSPVVEVTSQFATRDRAIDLAAPGSPASLPASDRKRYTAPSDLIPTDGIVKETAAKITAGAKTDLEKARRIYEWVVDNTFRNPKTRGCGLGDITFMLKSGDLSGKCADINALFVGLSRASGLPARDIYGIRLAASKFGYKCLGPSTGTVTKSQHCRADVFVDGYGWIPVDAGDVRKVVLEEPPGNLALTDSKVTAARKTLFGAWEGNWLAYNYASDVELPGSTGPKLGFLMYPQVETAAGRLDCLDPDSVRYSIMAREISV